VSLRGEEQRTAIRAVLDAFAEDAEAFVFIGGCTRSLSGRHEVTPGRAAGGWYAPLMMTVRSRVKNGRLVVDEPTDLPEGAEMELARVGDEPWELTPEQRAELMARVAGADRGELVPAAEVFARLRAG
jgi:hypothetical protein